VVILQFLGRAAFIEQLERLAEEMGTALREIVLLDSRDKVGSGLRGDLPRAADRITSTRRPSSGTAVVGPPPRCATG
jgi:hypothetical protein